MCHYCEKSGLPSLLTISNTLQDLKTGSEARLGRLEQKLEGLDDLVESKVATTIEKGKREMVEEIKTTVEETIATKVKEVVDKRLEDFAVPVIPNTGNGASASGNPNQSQPINVPGQQISPGTHLRQTVSRVSAEMRERSEIKNNLIIRKLQEPDTNVKVQRETADKDSLVDMFHGTLGIAVAKENIVKVIRLGRVREDKSARPLLVSLSAESLKDEVFRNVRKLQGTNYSSVSIAHDQTKLEREADQKLIREAQKDNQSKSGNWGYRVKGPPWDRKVIRFPLKNQQDGGVVATAQPSADGKADDLTVVQVHPAPKDVQTGEHPPA
jgi:hypothetical protein